jgi:putative membrane protein
VADPSTTAVRDHLANERTQLAWLRTGANVVVVGLAVARFADGGEVTAASLVAGGILIITGAVGILYGTLRYRRVSAAIQGGDIEVVTSSLGPSLAALVLLVAVAVSAIVLLAAA